MNLAPDIEQIPSVTDYSERAIFSEQVVTGKRIYDNRSCMKCTVAIYRVSGSKLVPEDFRFQPIRFSEPVGTALVDISIGYLTDAVRFQLLVNMWKSETGHYSLVQQKIIHPAYLEIIGMGEKALPFLINEIQRGSSHWFPALRAIAGSDRPRDEGDSFDEAVEVWTRWWSERHYRYARMDFAR